MGVRVDGVDTALAFADRLVPVTVEDDDDDRGMGWDRLWNRLDEDDWFERDTGS